MIITFKSILTLSPQHLSCAKNELAKLKPDRDAIIYGSWHNTNSVKRIIG